jgi:hypothetical protein
VVGEVRHAQALVDDVDVATAHEDVVERPSQGARNGSARAQ